MMRRLLLSVLLLSPALFGQCSTISPTSLTFSLPSYGPRPFAQTVTFTAAASFSISEPGDGESFVYDQNGNTSESTSGSYTLYAYIYGGHDQQAPITGQSQSFTLTIDGVQCSATVMHYSVIARNPVWVTNNLPGGVLDSAIPGSSSSSGWTGQYHDLVPYSNLGALPGGTPLLPANGSTRTLPGWGTTIKTCSPNGYTVFYASISELNKDDSMIFAFGPGGTPSVIDTATCTPHILSSMPSISGDTMRFDRQTANVGWYFSGANLIRVTINTSTYAQTWSTYTPFSGTTQITNGATDDITDDGWLGFSTASDNSGNTAHPNICMVNLTAPGTAYCRDMSIDFPLAASVGVNYTMMSKGFDSRTGKRYIWTNDNAGHNYGPIYSYTPGGSALAFEHMFGVAPEQDGFPGGYASNFTNSTCTSQAQAGTSYFHQGFCMYTGAHSHAAEDAQGHQYWVFGGSPVNGQGEPYHANATVIDVAAAQNVQTLATQLGGGLSYNFPAQPETTGCVLDWCAIKIVQGGTSWRITNAVTASSSIQLTLDSAPGSGLVTGSPISVDGVGGCTNANGQWGGGVVTVSGSTVTISGVTCNSSYTSSTGGIFNNSYPANSSFRGEVALLHIYNGTVVETRRLGPADLSVSWNDCYCPYSAGTYYLEGMQGLSQDLQWVVTNTNGGLTNNMQVVMIKTGIPPRGGAAAAAGVGASSL